MLCRCCSSAVWLQYCMHPPTLDRASRGQMQIRAALQRSRRVIEEEKTSWIGLFPRHPRLIGDGGRMRTWPSCDAGLAKGSSQPTGSVHGMWAVANVTLQTHPLVLTRATASEFPKRRSKADWVLAPNPILPPSSRRRADERLAGPGECCR